MGKLDNVIGQVLFLGIVLDPREQRPVDLYIVGGITDQGTDVGVAGSVIVNGKSHVVFLAALLDHRQVGVVHCSLLGEFDDDTVEQVAVFGSQLAEVIRL